jgi:plasmid stabilization system protein ParE
MDSYRNQFKTDFQRILKNPFIGTQRAELGDTIYGLVSGSHVIFYDIEANSIQIIKIIHGNCDIPKAFY